jgi:hypothetical protein
MNFWERTFAGQFTDCQIEICLVRQTEDNMLGERLCPTNCLVKWLDILSSNTKNSSMINHDCATTITTCLSGELLLGEVNSEDPAFRKIPPPSELEEPVSNRMLSGLDPSAALDVEMPC